MLSGCSELYGRNKYLNEIQKVCELCVLFIVSRVDALAGQGGPASGGGSPPDLPGYLSNSPLDSSHRADCLGPGVVLRFEKLRISKLTLTFS